MDGTGAESQSDDDEVYSCFKFFTGFLTPLSMEARKKAIGLIHEMNNPKAHVADAKERCTEILLLVEGELEPEHIICELLAKELAEKLKFQSTLEDAVELIENHIDRVKTQDFGSLLILSVMYSRVGEYRKASDLLKQAKSFAKASGDPILLSLALVKEACNLWHLQESGEAKRKVQQCLDTLKSFETALIENQFPVNPTTIRVIDIFKTLAYFYGILHWHSESAKYYKKALNIVEKDSNAVVQVLKLETRIVSLLLRSREKDEIVSHCMKGYEKSQEILKKPAVLTHHPLMVINALHRLSYSLESANKYDKALVIQKESCEIAEKYLNPEDPEVARLAAGTALLCNKMKNDQEKDFYVEKANAVLEVLSDVEDPAYTKLYVRELSDAWSLLGRVYQRMDFKNSERCFKEALTVNTRVYGCNHPRLSHLHKFLGHLYKQYQMYNEALIHFRKCKKISEEFDPKNVSFRQFIEKEIQEVRDLLSKTPL